MKISKRKMVVHFKESLALICALAIAICTVDSQLVPAIITFGDSSVDVGNNDYIHTFFKANYPPYGRDFANQEATGRFTNGKLATDITGLSSNQVYELLSNKFGQAQPIFFSPTKCLTIHVMSFGKVLRCQPTAILRPFPPGRELSV